jgi:hypothetical protein
MAVLDLSLEKGVIIRGFVQVKSEFNGIIQKCTIKPLDTSLFL